MAVKVYEAVVYVVVDDEEADEDEKFSLEGLQDWLGEAGFFDLDTEEHGDPFGVGSVTIEWSTLTELPPKRAADLLGG